MHYKPFAMLLNFFIVTSRKIIEYDQYQEFHAHRFILINATPQEILFDQVPCQRQKSLFGFSHKFRDIFHHYVNIQSFDV